MRFKGIGKLLLLLLGGDAIVLVLLVLFPGGGHSPLFYLLAPATVVVAKVAPDVGSCVPCAPLAWTIGSVLEVVAVCGLLAIGRLLLRSLHRRAV